MKHHIVTTATALFVCLLFLSSPGFASVSGSYEVKKIQPETSLFQSPDLPLFVAQKKEKASKRQNEIKKGVGMGKGKGLENRKDKSSDQDGDTGIPDGLESDELEPDELLEDDQWGIEPEDDGKKDKKEKKSKKEKKKKGKK